MSEWLRLFDTHIPRQDTETIIKIHYRVSDSCYIHNNNTCVSIKISRQRSLPVAECAAHPCIWPNIEVAMRYMRSNRREDNANARTALTNWLNHDSFSWVYAATASRRRDFLLPSRSPIFHSFFSFISLLSAFLLNCTRIRKVIHIKETTKCHIQCAVAANYKLPPHIIETRSAPVAQLSTLHFMRWHETRLVRITWRRHCCCHW